MASKGPPSFRQNDAQNLPENHVNYEVQIILKEGRNLVVCDITGSSDPYVKFRYNNKTIHKSKIIQQCLNPVWNERFRFIVKDIEIPLKVQVYDYDRFATDDFMGSADLHLSPFEKDKTYELKLMLNQEDSLNQYGYLTIQLLIQQNLADHEIKYQELSLASLPAAGSPEKSGKDVSQNFILHLTLVEGRGFSTNSINYALPEPEPYVKLRLGNEKFKSKVATAKSTSTFSWNEKFNFHFTGSPHDQDLKVIVCDRRKDILLGECIFSLIHIKEDGTYSGWFNLFDGAGQLFATMSMSTMLNQTEQSSSSCITPLRLAPTDVAKKYSLKRSLNDIKDIGCLTITVCRAKGLTAADIGGKSDPFCVLELVNIQFQTKTQYKTLNPEWNQTFMFNVNDVYSAVELTVYDDNPNGRIDFLGKVSIPLMRVKNGCKCWYRLKDAKLIRPTKGCILIEASLYWNPIRASLRVFQPKEQKYTYQEEKFKRRILMQHINRLKSSATIIADAVTVIRDLLNWEKPMHSLLALMGFIIVVYFFELYMLPILLLTVFAQKLYCRERAQGKEMIAMQTSESDLEDADETAEGKKSLRDKWMVVQDAMCTVQNGLGYVAALLERMQNLFNFTEPFLSSVACITLVVGFLVLYFIPIRWLIIIWGTNKFTKKLRDPTAIQNNELLDFLSRVPSRDEQKTFEEPPLEDEEKLKGRKRRSPTASQTA